MSLKPFFQGVWSVIKAPYYAIKFLFKIIKTTIIYIYNACDKAIEHLILWTRSLTEGFKAKNKGTKQHRIAKSTLTIVASVLLVAIVAYTARQCMFFVPVGGGAIVTRFGAFQRDVGMGLHFRIPLLERYYIIRTGFIKEETFGFLQFESPIRHQRLTTNERNFQTQYEAELLRREADDEVFAKKGSIVAGLEQQQRLTHDYLREMVNGNKPLTIAQAKEILRRNQQEVHVLQQEGVSQNGRLPLSKQSRLITRDLNIIHLTWSLQYQIHNMREYLFNSRDVQENIRDIALAAMSEVIGRTNYNDIMTVGRQNIEQQVKYFIQSRLDKLKEGIKITQVIVIDALPVREVKFAFDEVNKAAQDKERYIYQAQERYQKVIPEAKGTAKKITAEAQAYAIKIRNKADGQAGQFEEILKEYLRAPDITNDRLYINAMDKLLSNSPAIIVDPKLKGILPVYNTQSQKSVKEPRAQEGIPPTLMAPLLKSDLLMQHHHVEAETVQQAPTPAANSTNQTASPSTITGGQQTGAVNP